MISRFSSRSQHLPHAIGRLLRETRRVEIVSLGASAPSRRARADMASQTFENRIDWSRTSLK
jgi:hypothetical protein